MKIAGLPNLVCLDSLSDSRLLPRMKSPATRKRSIVQGILVLVIVGIVLICFGGMDSVFRENRTELKLEGRGQNPPIMGIKVPNTAAYSRSEGVDFIVHYISLEATAEALEFSLDVAQIDFWRIPIIPRREWLAIGT